MHWFCKHTNTYHVVKGDLYKIFNSAFDAEAFKLSREVFDHFTWRIDRNGEFFCLTSDREYAMRVGKRAGFKAYPNLKIIKDENND